MPIENSVVAVICWASSLLIGVIIGTVAIWANRHKKPMPFWSGSNIEPEEISDISAYNRANCLMWTIYAACMALAGVLSLFSILTGAIIFGISLVLGTFVLIKVYKNIYNKYKTESGRYRVEI